MEGRLQVIPDEVLASGYISSRYTNYLICASLTTLVLELVQTLQLEVELVWKGPSVPVKTLYFVNRYFPFVALAVLVLYNDAPSGLSPRACQILFSASTVGMALTMLAADILVYIRLYALSGRSRGMKVFLVVHISVVAVTCLTCLGLYISQDRWISSPDAALKACVGQTPGLGRFMMACAVTLLYNSLFTAGLSLWFGLRIHRSIANGVLRNVLYRDGAVYIITIAIVSVANAIVASFAPERYRLLLVVPQGVAHNLLASRMVLHIRKSRMKDIGFSVELNNTFAYHPSQPRVSQLTMTYYK
ncbi:hypothetical protein BKA70DRAFT_512492 [Coprinopsis sp. MPI-PUGE-AT-0042]|nr:hypothetical protein BKA70DRAFT_642364 [Coprinopsis sp. MPI-PUGE-AT-0042]KAH6904864.1 hypothetical protein BKA70DRAFT_512492 [Coprinopsis sp. MPI-PUGE-AT-0042]